MIEPYWSDETCSLYLGDALAVLREMPDASVDCCVTSPPYYNLRDYGTDGQIGLERSPAAYVERLCEVFAEVRRVLADDGTLWLNIGDSWSNRANSGPSADRSRGRTHGANTAKRVNTTSLIPRKGIIGIPWRTAFALQDDGWILRNAIVWHQPNGTPESVKDRLTERHEYVFLLAKQTHYYFGLDAIREPHAAVSISRAQPHRAPSGLINGDHPSDTAKHMATARMLHPMGANPGDVWTIHNTPYPEAHFATFPVELPIRCIKTTRPGAVVLDPFSGAGTTGEACRRLGRRYIGIDLKAAYHDLAVKRYAQGVLSFGEAS